MFCTQCGSELPENSKFCNKCGAAQKPSVDGNFIKNEENKDFRQIMDKIYDEREGTASAADAKAPEGKEEHYFNTEPAPDTEGDGYDLSVFSDKEKMSGAPDSASEKELAFGIDDVDAGDKPDSLTDTLIFAPDQQTEKERNRQQLTQMIQSEKFDNQIDEMMTARKLFFDDRQNQNTEDDFFDGQEDMGYDMEAGDMADDYYDDELEPRERPKRKKKKGKGVVVFRIIIILLVIALAMQCTLIGAKMLAPKSKLGGYADAYFTKVVGMVQKLTGTSKETEQVKDQNDSTQNNQNNQDTQNTQNNQNNQNNKTNGTDNSKPTKENTQQPQQPNNTNQ